MKLTQLPEDLKAMLAILQTSPLDMVAAAFHLGSRVAQQVEGRGKLPVDKLLETVRSIATGELTLQPSGAELRALAPNRQDLESLRTENQKVDQIIAHLFIEYQSLQARNSKLPPS